MKKYFFEPRVGSRYAEKWDGYYTMILGDIKCVLQIVNLSRFVLPMQECGKWIMPARFMKRAEKIPICD